MFPFNLTNVLEVIKPKMAKSKYFEPLFQNKHEHYIPPSPNEIRRMTEKLSRCPHCQFLIFNNYWASDVENISAKLCPTCGCKV